MAVYVFGLKNAAIASQAVTIAEAQRLAVEKGHLVITPKIVAGIIGKGRALDLSIKLTNLHTITPMIDTYNELINKTERTTEE